MIIGEEIRLFDWFIIHFTENKGMAFGMEFGGKWESIYSASFEYWPLVASLGT